MKNESIDSDKLISDYISFATIEGNSKLTGDYKTGNSMAKKLNKIYQLISADVNIATNILGAAMKSESARARSLSAVDALRMNILIKEAVAVLEEESRRDDILGFGSVMALKIWRGEIAGTSL